MDCKKALEDADGNFEKAERILKELGKAAAAKRSGRATNEGRIFVGTSGNQAVIIELTCETDFVARNDGFVALGQALAADAMARGLTTPDAAMEARVQETISTIKENMTIRRMVLLKKADNELFSHYIHGDSGRLGGIVVLRVDSAAAANHPAVKEFAFDCALHVVASRPAYLSEETVDEAYRKEQREIFLAQAQNQGKAEKVIESMVNGKLRKHFEEICMLKQPFVKDDQKSVAAVAAEVGKAAGTKIEVVGYTVLGVGEDQ